MFSSSHTFFWTHHETSHSLPSEPPSGPREIGLIRRPPVCTKSRKEYEGRPRDNVQTCRLPGLLVPVFSSLFARLSVCGAFLQFCCTRTCNLTFVCVLRTHFGIFTKNDKQTSSAQRTGYVWWCQFSAIHQREGADYLFMFMLFGSQFLHRHCTLLLPFC